MSKHDPIELNADAILEVLLRHEVEFVVIGGFAGVLYGSGMMTLDIDITPESSDKNLARLCEALVELEARVRTPGTDQLLDWEWNAAAFANLTTAPTRTKFGDLDISLRPDAPDGSFTYDDLAENAVVIEIPRPIPVASLDDIIASKEAADRPKDHRTLDLLRRLRDRLD